MHIIKYRNLYFILPATLVLLSIVAIALFGLKPGIDLQGGALLEVSYQGTLPPQEELLQRVEALPLGEVRLQRAGEDGYIVRTRMINVEEKNALLQALSLPENAAQEERFTSIGPTIGQEIRNKGWIAIGLVILTVIAYVAFVFRHVSKPVASWKYGTIAIVTLLHDIIIPMGLFAILGEFFGAEAGSLFIVALLTILGISINDTIVVFDRIRENLRNNLEHNIKEPFESTVGKSMDETTARSINTSLAVIVALLALYFVGPESTKDMALVLTVGMIAGTYSSIFLASPLLVVWERLVRKK